MLFSMIASLLQKLPVPRVVTLILTGMVEITNGIAMLPDSGLPQSVQYVLAVVYTAFGGLSGIAQTSSMIRDTPLSIKLYCIAKLLLAACCGLLACLVSQIFHLGDSASSQPSISEEISTFGPSAWDACASVVLVSGSSAVGLSSARFAVTTSRNPCRELT